VAPDIIVTAGHCLLSTAGCISTRFVFGFAIEQEGVVPQYVSESEVYSCTKVIHAKQNDTDFSVVQLSRSVIGHTPLNIRRSGHISVGTPLFVIGHPAGLPTKIAGGASVRSNFRDGYFVANLDTYGGNSGSAVFNAEDGKVEGILVRGETDFTNENGCSMSNVCTNNGCRGEDVTYITEVLPYLSDDSTPVQRQVDFISEGEIVSIPDANAGGIESRIEVPDSPRGRQVNISIDVTHSWRGDLLIKLIDPTGTSYVLHNRSGSSRDNVIGTYGTDLDAHQDLSSLSQAGSGTWTLRVSDHAYWDRGTLNSWGIHFR